MFAKLEQLLILVGRPVFKFIRWVVGTRKQGKLVVIEGVGGSGKSSVMAELEKRGAFEGWLRVREPGSTDFAEHMRIPLFGHPEWKIDPLAVIFGYNAARVDLYKQMIFPALKEGQNVVEDRSWWTSLSFQITEGVPWLLGWLLCMIAVRFKLPDLVIFLDVSPEESEKRKIARKVNGEPSGKEVDRFDQKEVAFHIAARRRYLLLTKLYPRSSVVVDTTYRTVEEVVELISNILVDRKIIKKVNS